LDATRLARLTAVQLAPLELLAGKMVRRTDHAALSREFVHRSLAENELKP
jgi:hypothetical protein